MQNVELKGLPGGKIAIIGEIAGVQIDKNGVTYCIITSPDADADWVADSDALVPYEDPAKAEDKPAVEETVEEAPEEETKEELEDKPEEKVFDEIKANGMKIKRRLGRPKKATVEDTMRKLEEMRARGEA